MNEKFWDRMAVHYDDEIFDTLSNDHNNTITRHILRYSSPASIACDFGCGVGKYLPLLGKRFHTVYAIDLSARCLNSARAACRSLPNLVYIKSDLALPHLKIKPVDFALSVNVLIMPSPEKRQAIFQNISKHTARKGHFLLVVPSLESALYSNYRLREWNHRSKPRFNDVLTRRLESTHPRAASVASGLLKIDGVPTKHYLKEELTVLLKRVHFEVLSLRKVEYSWTTEFPRPPRWMKAPYPWDWLLVCQKV